MSRHCPECGTPRHDELPVFCNKDCEDNYRRWVLSFKPLPPKKHIKTENPCIYRVTARIGIDDLKLQVRCKHPIITDGVKDRDTGYRVPRYAKIESPLICMDCEHRDKGKEDPVIKSVSPPAEKDTEENTVPPLKHLQTNIENKMIELRDLQRLHSKQTGSNYKPPLRVWAKVLE